MDIKPYLQEISLDSSAVDSFETYPFNIPSIRNLSIRFHQDVTFLVGENGSGKSTLMEGMVQSLGLPASGGSIHGMPPVVEESLLAGKLKYTRGIRRPKDYFFLRAESLYNVASYLDDTYGSPMQFAENYGVDSLHKCSHGEAFLAIMNNRLSKNGLYFFDEPEAALSPMRQLTALAIIDRLVKKGSQLIIATHSPILLSYPNALIYQFGEDGIKKISYEETEAFSITKSFLNNYPQSLDLLFGD